MEPEPAPRKESRPKGWIGTLRRTLDNLIRIHHQIEEIRRENQVLRRQVTELAKLVHYQAGQIQQIDQRIRDAVEAQVLRELDRPAQRLATVSIDPSSARRRTTW